MIDLFTPITRAQVDEWNALAKTYNPTPAEIAAMAAQSTYSTQTVAKWFQNTTSPRNLVRLDVIGLSPAQLKGEVLERELYRVAIAVALSGGATGDFFTRAPKTTQETTVTLPDVFKALYKVFTDRFETAKVREYKVEKLETGWGITHTMAFPDEGEYEDFLDFFDEDADALDDDDDL